MMTHRKKIQKKETHQGITKIKYERKSHQSERIRKIEAAEQRLVKQLKDSSRRGKPQVPLKTAEVRKKEHQSVSSTDDDDDEKDEESLSEGAAAESDEEQEGQEDDTSQTSHRSLLRGGGEYTSAHSEAQPGETFDLKLQVEEGLDAMTLRRRVVKKGPQQKSSQQDLSDGMCPLLAKGPKNNFRYVPWSFMDMITLAGKLAPLTDGADKWIETLEGIMGGIKLAGGDIKALLVKTAGQTATADMFRVAGYAGMMTTHHHDEVPFDKIRTHVWRALREKYPSRMDTAKLERGYLKDSDTPSQFLHNYQRMWKAETGSEWDVNESTKALFMLYVENAMPPEVQAKLKGVVGLMKMEWPVFSERIIHYVNAHRAEKQAQDDQSKLLANKLTQLQIGELTKQKKERPKPQTAVSVALPEPVGETAEGGVRQAPIITPTMSPPPAPAGPNVFSKAPPAGQIQNQQVPPIHLHLGGGIQQPHTYSESGYLSPSLLLSFVGNMEEIG